MGKSRSIRLDEEYIVFSEKAQNNRVRAGTDKKTIDHPRLSKALVKFFKINNDCYLKFIQMEEKNNA